MQEEEMPEVAEEPKGFKEAHEKADNTSTKTLIPSCVLRALFTSCPPSILLLPLLHLKIKASGIKGRAVHL